jgi:uncharacterized phiE125 gp8 family phage protein
MYKKETLITDYAPISVLDMLYHNKIDITDDAENAYVSALLEAAQGYFLEALDMRFGSYTIEQYYDRRDLINVRYIRDLMPLPVTEITSVQVLGEDGNYTDLSATSYIKEIGHDDARVCLNQLPCFNGNYSVLKITYKAGYTTDNPAPKLLIEGIKLLFSNWYENRSPVVTGTMVNEIPLSVNSIISLLKHHKAY